MLENDTISSQQFRVMSVEEKDGINYGISALAYVKEKYDFIEDGTAIPTHSGFYPEVTGDNNAYKIIYFHLYI